jgi:hypothetical protein
MLSSPLFLILGKNQKARKRAGTRQRRLDVAASADAREGIRQGLEDVKKARPVQREKWSPRSAPNMLMPR